MALIASVSASNTLCAVNLDSAPGRGRGGVGRGGVCQRGGRGTEVRKGLNKVSGHAGGVGEGGRGRGG